jgi:hypothetical protein
LALKSLFWVAIHHLLTGIDPLLAREDGSAFGETVQNRFEQGVQTEEKAYPFWFAVPMKLQGERLG